MAAIMTVKYNIKCNYKSPSLTKMRNNLINMAVIMTVKYNIKCNYKIYDCQVTITYANEKNNCVNANILEKIIIR
jgi:hypothetical protein